MGDGQGGRVCQCPECGAIPLQPQDFDAVMLDQDWLRANLRLAMASTAGTGS